MTNVHFEPEDPNTTASEVKDLALNVKAIADHRWRWITALGTVLFLLFAGVSVVALNASMRANENADAIRDLEHKDVTLSRIQDFRSCYRQNFVRAELLTRLARREFAYTPNSQAEQIHAEQQRRLHQLVPILDCAPALQGRAPVPLPVAAQEAFVARYASGNVNPEPVLGSPR